MRIPPLVYSLIRVLEVEMLRWDENTPPSVFLETSFAVGERYRWDEMRCEYPPNFRSLKFCRRYFFGKRSSFFEFEFGLSLGSNVAWVWVRLTRPLVVSTVTPPTALRLCWLSFWAAMFPSQWEACQQKYLHTITVQVSCCTWADRWTISPMLVAYVPKTSESPRDWLSKIFFLRLDCAPWLTVYATGYRGGFCEQPLT